MNQKLFTLLVTYNIVQLAGAMLGPIYALYVQKVGGDLLDASFAGAAYAVSTGLGMIIFGFVEDKIKDKKLLMILGFILTGLTYLYYIFVSTMWHLLIAQILIGIGNSMYTPAHDFLYAKHLDKGRSGSEWGVWEATYNFAVALGAIVGGYVAVNLGFNILFIIMGALCFAAVLYLMRGVEK